MGEAPITYASAKRDREKSNFDRAYTPSLETVGIQRSPVGGALLTNYIASLFQSQTPPIDVVPHYLVKDKSTVPPNEPANAVIRDDRLKGATESFARYAQNQVIHNFKESVLQVYEGPYDET